MTAPNHFFHKNASFLANALASSLFCIGILLQNHFITTVGAFALAGGLTNWLAIHMLFERVPFLYGSGVIPRHFTIFKSALHNLIVEQFLRPELIENFIQQKILPEEQHLRQTLQHIAEKVDTEKMYKGLVDAILASSFGSFIKMMGGSDALLPLKEPFEKRLKNILQEVVNDIDIAELQKKFMPEQSTLIAALQQMIEARLEVLTPSLIKEIAYKMMEKHLGWLVIWGAIAGGLSGVAFAALQHISAF